MTVELRKELQLMQELKEKAIKEWRVFDIATIERIISILQEHVEQSKKPKG